MYYSFPRLYSIDIFDKNTNINHNTTDPVALKNFSKKVVMTTAIYWNENVILKALKVVKMTTSSAASNEYFIKMTPFPCQCIRPPTLHVVSGNYIRGKRKWDWYIWLPSIPIIFIQLSYMYILSLTRVDKCVKYMTFSQSYTPKQNVD